jgi:hypothetical protein
MNQVLTLSTSNDVDLSNILIRYSQEVVQSVRTTPNEADVTSSNLLSSFLCGHVKKKNPHQVIHVLLN